MAGPYVGQGDVVGVAVNADSSGTTWGGTPGTEIALRPYPGTMKFDEAQKQTPVADLRVDEGYNVTGGIGYTGSFEVPASYLGLELPLQLIAGGALATASGAAPYTWPILLANLLLYGRIGYYGQDRAATAVSHRFTNAVITALTLSCNAEEEAKVAISWAAATKTTGTEAIPTPVVLEPILWSHLAPSFNSVTTHQLYSVKVEIAQPVTDAEFCMAASTPTAMSYIQRAGQRTYSVEAEFLHSSIVDTLAALKTAIPIALVFDNGGATSAERELSATAAACYLEGRSETKGAWGVQKTTLKWFHRSPTAWDIQIKNGDGVIP